MSGIAKTVSAPDIHARAHRTTSGSPCGSGCTTYARSIPTAPPSPRTRRSSAFSRDTTVMHRSAPAARIARSASSQMGRGARSPSTGPSSKSGKSSFA